MKSEEIVIANLSCNGCVNTITRKLTSLDGVDNVMVSLDDSKVSVRCDDAVERNDLTDLLRAIGYPETTEQNGLLTKVRSINSCLTGRITN